MSKRFSARESALIHFIPDNPSDKEDYVLSEEQYRKAEQRRESLKKKEKKYRQILGKLKERMDRKNNLASITEYPGEYEIGRAHV